MKSRLLLADDHEVVVEGRRRILEPHCDLVAALEDGRALLNEAERLGPDVIVTDVAVPAPSMPSRTGHTAQIRPMRPVRPFCVPHLRPR